MSFHRPLLLALAAFLLSFSSSCGCGDQPIAGDPRAGEALPGDGGTSEIACVVDDDCPFGAVCGDDGSCLPPDEGLSDEGCWSDADCRPQHVCAPATGRCVPEGAAPLPPGSGGDGPCTEGQTRFCGTKVGACEYGVERCHEGEWSGECEGAVQPQSETCDGLDNDCDGEVDESFGLGVACTEGAGACERSGFVVCTADRLASRCSATAGPAEAEELCGGELDDDCDGEEEEGFELIEQACAVGTGACRRTGSWICSADRLGAECSAVAAEPAEAELCGFHDDDNCDGLTDADEFPLLDQACLFGEAPCQAEGLWQCDANGAGVVCVPTQGGGGDELCNGVDDNANQCVDEGFDVGLSCAVGVGACRDTGLRVCTADGLATTCDAVAGEPLAYDICGNGADDDCDGVPEEDEYPELGTACAAGIGGCRRTGVQVCTASGDGTECGAVAGEPEPELCGNNRDDNCNGVADADEFPELGETCRVGIGACRREGQWICGDDGAVVCSVRPGSPSVEICDNVDNSCNGTVDDGCDDDDDQYCDANMGLGPNGSTLCPLSTSSASLDCNDSNENIHPGADEICGDGKDSNCDGENDDGCGNCDPAVDRDFDGYDECSDCNDLNGAIHPGATELCDGVDNDCDDVIDEGFDADSDGYTTCGTQPTGGLLASWIDCDDTEATVHPFACELCADESGTVACGAPNDRGNDVDENCNGYADENCAPCNNSDTDGDDVSECEGDCEPDDGAVAPGFAEVCDGKDNDCNKLTVDNCEVGDTCNHDGDSAYGNDPDVCDEGLLCVESLGNNGSGTGNYSCTSLCNFSLPGAGLGDGCEADQICGSSLTPTANMHGCQVSAAFGAEPVGTFTSAEQCRSGRTTRTPPPQPKDYCTDYCGSDAYCGNGTVCQAVTSTLAQCMIPTSSETRGVGEACNDSPSYCRSDNATCLEVAAGDDRCSAVCCTNSDCPADWYCSLNGPRASGPVGGLDTIPMCYPEAAGNLGRPAGAACTSNSQCASEYCDKTLEVCVELCCHDGTCPVGLTCEEAVMTVPVRAGELNGQTIARVCLGLSPADPLERK